MNLELLETLEAKIQITLETLEMLNLELEEEKIKNAQLNEQNQRLIVERQEWNEKVIGLVDLLPKEPVQFG